MKYTSICSSITSVIPALISAAYGFPVMVFEGDSLFE